MSVLMDDRMHKITEMDHHVQILPDDVILNILFRQPAKCVAQLKLLSKHWYFVISDFCLPKSIPTATSFIFFQLERKTGIPHLHFLPYVAYDNKNPAFRSGACAKDFQDCCNGLLLLAHTSAIPVHYIVYNPFTRECRPLPVNSKHKRSEFCSASLAFEPSISLNYRVVRLFFDATISKHTVDVFWSEIGKWSDHTIDLNPQIYGFKWNKHAIYLNGLLYMVSNTKFLVRIDLKEAWTRRASPNLKASALELPERDGTDDFGVIGSSRGYLYYSNSVKSHSLFWMLDDGFKWVLKHSILMEEFYDYPVVRSIIQNHPLAQSCYFKTYAFHPHKEEEILIGTPAYLFRYHFETKSIETIYEAAASTNHIIGSGHLVYPYAQCPVIINSVLREHKCSCKLSGKRGIFVDEHIVGDTGYQLKMDQQHVRGLPDDGIANILVRIVPDKCLARLKLVSRRWYFIISELSLAQISPPPSSGSQVSNFIFMKFKHKDDVLEVKKITNDRHLGSQLTSIVDYSSSFPLEQNAQDFQDCCNGLLLLANSSTNPVQYCVFNPYTREYIPLPVNPDQNKCLETRYASLAFDPCISPRYKVVCFFGRPPSNMDYPELPFVEIFWSESGKWSRNYLILEDNRVYGVELSKRSIYLKGLMYILSSAKFLMYIDLKEAEACRNLEASSLELPDKDMTDDYGVIGISKGYLYHSNSVKSHLLFWVLDDEFKWVLKHSIYMDEFFENPVLKNFMWKYFTIQDSWFKTYAFHPHDEKEIIMGTPAYLFRYHFETKKIELLYEIGIGSDGLIAASGHLVYPYAPCPIILQSVLRKQHECTAHVR